MKAATDRYSWDCVTLTPRVITASHHPSACG